MDLQRLGSLAPDVRNAPISALHIGPKTQAISAGGVQTVGQLIDRLSQGAALTSIPGVGRSAVEATIRSLDALSVALTDSYDVDWDIFAFEMGYSLVPEHSVSDGKQLLDYFPSVTNCLIGQFNNAVDRLILAERLTKPHDDQMTLDAIAHAAPEPITRERVRQREAKLLSAISNALLYNDHNGLDFHFRQSFSTFWIQAAEIFGEETKVNLHQFNSGISAAWNVPPDQILDHLPFITSILTSKTQLPAALRPRRGLDRRLFAQFDAKILSRPIARLALGKWLEQYLDEGITTLGDLIEGAKANRLPPSSTRAGQCADTVLRGVADGLRPDGSIDWEGYAEAIGLITLPNCDRASPAAFLEHLNRDVEAILLVNSTAARAATVYRLRTSVPYENRPTLAQMAISLDTHGPTIKREETDLLELLHEQLIDREFSLSKVFFPSCFLAHWQEAGEIYDSSSRDYRQFRSAIATQWAIHPRFLDRHGAGLWSVLDLYPQGRLTRSRAAKRQSHTPLDEFTGGVIILRGFRRAH